MSIDMNLSIDISIDVNMSIDMSIDVNKHVCRYEQTSPRGSRITALLRTTELDTEMDLRINAKEIAEIQSLRERQLWFKYQFHHLYGDLGQTTFHLGLNFLICKVG